MSPIKLKHEKTKYVYKRLVLDWCFLPNLAELLLNILPLLNSFFKTIINSIKSSSNFIFGSIRWNSFPFFQIYIYIFSFFNIYIYKTQSFPFTATLGDTFPLAYQHIFLWPLVKALPFLYWFHSSPIQPMSFKGNWLDLQIKSRIYGSGLKQFP